MSPMGDPFCERFGAQSCTLRSVLQRVKLSRDYTRRLECCDESDSKRQYTELIEYSPFTFTRRVRRTQRIKVSHACILPRLFSPLDSYSSSRKIQTLSISASSTQCHLPINHMWKSYYAVRIARTTCVFFKSSCRKSIALFPF